jgi:Methyltransferase domain.
MSARRLLSRPELKAHYDRVGAWQDTQAFYEAPALDALISAGAFHGAASVIEVGCGTGRLAERLLRTHCPPHARYEGYDLSETMVQVARSRLASFEDRATVRQTDGRLTFDRPDGGHDRVVATYLLDLLSREEAQNVSGGGASSPAAGRTALPGGAHPGAVVAVPGRESPVGRPSPAPSGMGGRVPTPSTVGPPGRCPVVRADAHGGTGVGRSLRGTGGTACLGSCGGSLY